MHKKLTEILIKTKEDLIERKQSVTINKIKSLIDQRDRKEFVKALNFPKDGSIAIIAEVKLASPNESSLGDKKEMVDRVKDYEQTGADAISVVTEKHFFQGDPLFISEIREVTSLPILQKDFVIDEYQIYEAKIFQADALLLIAKILTEQELVSLVELTQKIGIEPVVEINSDEDLKKSLKTNTKIIAVNARDLDTFEVNVDRACELLKQIPDRFIKLGFSGIKGKEEIEKYKGAGANGVLIGTSLMRSKNISEFMRGITI